MRLQLHITPVGKPRMTQRDKWQKRPAVMKYRAFCDQLRIGANQQKFELKPDMHYTFYMPMPKSWSKKKKQLMLGTPHRQKPDLDNLIKSVWDALCPEDAHIHSIGSAKKVWNRIGFIEIYE